MVVYQNKISPLLAIKDSVFDTNQIAHYALFIELGIDQFRFCVVDTRTHQVLVLEDYAVSNLLHQHQMANWIDELFESHDFIKYTNWKNIAISFNTLHFTLVPDEFFRKEYGEGYWQLVTGEAVKLTERLIHQAIKSIKARNLFVVEIDVWEQLMNKYSLSNLLLLHQVSTLIEGTLAQANTEAKLLMNLYFEEEFVTVVLAQNGKLLLCNKFTYKTPIDMGYFIMFVLDSLQLKPADVACFLYGEITPYTEDYSLLKKFFTNLQFGKKLSQLRWGEAFEDVPEHRYFGLYNIATFALL